jgi:hypothetical protein
MTSATVESRMWARPKWLLLVALVFAGQVGFIFWLAARKPDVPIAPVAGPAIYLPADQSTDLPGVSDPTLFVLPNSHGFSAAAWMEFPPANYAAKPWTEPPRPLPLQIPQLGSTLLDYVRSDRPQPFELALKPPPQVDALGWLPLENTESTYSIEGDLAERALLTPLKLQSWPAADILTNSVIQIAVDSAGRVFSATPLVKTLSAEANSNALYLARLARFAPLRWLDARPPAPANLAWGRIVFHWHTVAPTNSIALLAR